MPAFNGGNQPLARVTSDFWSGVRVRESIDPDDFRAVSRSERHFICRSAHCGGKAVASCPRFGRELQPVGSASLADRVKVGSAALEKVKYRPHDNSPQPRHNEACCRRLGPV
jgi:hypothetical protein